MSIASEILRLQQAKAALKESIENKGVSVDPKSTLDTFHARVDEITSGSLEPLEEPGVQYIDYDGTVLYQYTHEEFQELSAHPEQPAHEGLIIDGWNTPKISDAQTFSRDHPKSIITIGAHYATAEGGLAVTKIHFHVNVRSDTTSNAVTLQYKASGSTTVDWGDGSSVTKLTGNNYSNVSATHAYSEEGDYVITISGDVQFYGTGSGLGTNPCSCVFKEPAHVASITEINLGNTVTLGSRAFAGCINLEKVSIPHSLESSFNKLSFGTDCYAHCYKLKSIVLSNLVTSIADGSFQYCYALETVAVPIISKSIGFGIYAFSACCRLKSFAAKNLHSDSYLFSACYSLVACCIERLTGMLDGIFKTNYSLKYLDVQGAVGGGDYMFEANYSMETYDFSGVSGIGEDAFCDNIALREIGLPASVVYIGTGAFRGCTSLQWVVMESSTPPDLGTTAFGSNHPDFTIIVPDGSGDIYKNATNWTNYASHIHEASEEE